MRDLFPNAWHVARREYQQRVRTRTFLVVTAILSSSRQSFSVLTQLGGEFGVNGRVGALPARFGPRGIVETRVPELDTRQQVRLQVALGG